MSHAILSPSAAHKWLNCPPSARLEAALPDSTSAAAEIGTHAHELAALKLNHALGRICPMEYDQARRKLEADPRCDQTMRDNTDSYRNYVMGICARYGTAAHVIVEHRTDLTPWAPESYGTTDCAVVGGHELHVIDYKNGRGVPVDADGNPQLRLYGLGVLAAYDDVYDIDTVTMHIFQPNIQEDGIFETLPASDLRDWGERMRPIAEQAYKGLGDYTPGPWCRSGFCKAHGHCRAQRDHYLSLEAFGRKLPPLLSNAEMGDALTRARDLICWMDKLEELSLVALLNGEAIPGWKAVEGRSNRVFSDSDKAFAAAIAHGIPEAALYERRPITLTATEKLMGKKAFTQVLGEYIVKPEGKPALAPASDKRPAIAAGVTAAEAFADEYKEDI